MYQQDSVVEYTADHHLSFHSKGKYNKGSSLIIFTVYMIQVIVPNNNKQVALITTGESPEHQIYTAFTITQSNNNTRKKAHLKCFLPRPCYLFWE